ncbi:hypothetical protein D9619_003784 [Psilocybe cf. subviscida]|uniref:Uncharacterized protein n=1 Tax=Psilocybe cf. subviscida TaxID=2480587 RepID=A0A8H5AW68_9AGAR|nr:hypothetical protein D9619_003784 [Psilocybe cf. subviscida]
MSGVTGADLLTFQLASLSCYYSAQPDSRPPIYIQWNVCTNMFLHRVAGKFTPSTAHTSRRSFTSSWIDKRQVAGTTPSLDLVTAFEQSSWIWTMESDPPNAPAGSVAFQKTFTPPAGKLPTHTNILMTVDDQFSLFVDGNFVGQSPRTADIWKNAQFFMLVLNPSASHLFAVNATNLADFTTGGPGPAGILAAIEMQFSDGTSSILTADSSWIYTTSPAAGWNTPAGDTSGWSAAQLINAYGAGPWGTEVLIPTSASNSCNATFDNSLWIWSAESNPPNAPPGLRAFRKTFTAPSGKTLQSASIILTVDNEFTFFVDGQSIGQSLSETDAWKSAQAFTAPLSGTSAVFAVNATNLPDPNSGGDSAAGLLATICITFTDGSSQTIVSDITWKVFNTVPAGFQSPSFNDLSWNAAHSQGAFGVAPWNKDAIVTTSPATGGQSAPLSASTVLSPTSIPFLTTNLPAPSIQLITTSFETSTTPQPSPSTPSKSKASRNAAGFLTETMTAAFSLLLCIIVNV